MTDDHGKLYWICDFVLHRVSDVSFWLVGTIKLTKKKKDNGMNRSDVEPKPVAGPTSATVTVRKPKRKPKAK
jgi:hypothetical protein